MARDVAPLVDGIDHLGQDAEGVTAVEAEVLADAQQRREGVVAHLARQPVVAVVAVQRVPAVAAQQLVIVAAAIEGVVAQAPVQPVGAGAVSR